MKQTQVVIDPPFSLWFAIGFLSVFPACPASFLLHFADQVGREINLNPLEGKLFQGVFCFTVTNQTVG